MTRSRFSRRRGRGFTLIEVLMVLAILVIIAGLAATNIFGLFESGKVRAAKAQLATFNTALDWYKLEWSDYPQSLDVLLQQAATPDGRVLGGGAWLDRLPPDPWNTPYGYQYPGSRRPNKPDMWSCGPDRVSGTQDDIWQD